MGLLYIRQRISKISKLKILYRNLRRYFYLSDQDGFFEHALFASNVPVIDSSFKKVLRIIQTDDISYVCVNAKMGFGGWEDRIVFLKKLFDQKSVSKALFINHAQAEFLPPEDVLDTFDVIFKREPFKDRDRYDISEANKAKIVPTMISCPFVHAPRDNLLSKAYHLVRPKVPVCRPEEAVYEVGFSGADAAGHSLRRDVWQRVVEEGFTRIGGLQPNPVTKELVPEKLQGPRYKGRAYRDALCQAKINLALDGIGQYTFRHQELLYLGAFMMSGPSIRELELPMPLEEDVHYVAFDDLDDMVSKIRYYLAHEDERQKIAAAGKKLFDEYYDPVRHGQEIVAALERVQR